MNRVLSCNASALARVCGSLAVMLACACSSPTDSTGVGNPSLTLSLVSDEQAELAREENSGGTAGAGSEGPDIDPGDDEGLPSGAVHQATIVLGALRFLPCDAALQPTVVRGPFVVDLKLQSTEPALPSVPVVPGGYCGIDAPLVPAQAPAEIAGRSLFFSGERADGTQFILYADVRVMLRLRARPGRVWDAAQTPHVLWAFRPRRWLAQRELDAVTAGEAPSGAASIVIDVDQYPLLFRLILARIAGRSSLHLDRDADGRLDADERDAEALLGQGLEDAD